MWDFFNNFGSKASGFLKDNSDVLQGAGAIVGGLSNAYSAYKQGRMASKNYNLNLNILKDEIRRKNAAQNALNTAWKNSNFNKVYTKKDEEENNGLV